MSHLAASTLNTNITSNLYLGNCTLHFVTTLVCKQRMCKTERPNCLLGGTTMCKGNRITAFISATVILMLLLSPVHVTPCIADSCNHNWIDTYIGYSRRLFSVTDAGHVYRYFKIMVCTYCNEHQYVLANDPSYPDEVEPHSFSSFRLSDLGHVENTELHRFTFACTASFCNCTAVRSVICDLGCIHYVVRKPPVVE